MTPKLKNLQVVGIDHIECIWQSLPPTFSSCIQNLIDLRVDNCSNLEELFSCSMAKESREKGKQDTILFAVESFKANKIEFWILC